MNLDLLQSLGLCPDFILLAIAVYAIVLCVRRPIDKLTKSYWWQDVVLPILPIPVGAILSLSLGGHLLCGIAGGLLSGTVVRVVKRILKNGQGA